MPRSHWGATRVGKEGMEVTFRKNRQYIENLKKVVGAVGKKAYGAYIANVLNNVVQETVKDSGRAAANWNLSFGKVSMSGTWDPEHYGQTYNEGKGPIGFRGDKGLSSAAQQVAYYKGFHYGYTLDADGVNLVPKGLIFNSLKIGEFSNPPAAYIHNPILDPQYSEYANNAFKTALSNETITAGIDSKIAGTIPRLIRETANEYKFPLTSKR